MKLVYVTPEIFIGEFIKWAMRKRVFVSTVVIDECHSLAPFNPAHRPAYSDIPNVISIIAKRQEAAPKCLLLTATADKETMEHLSLLFSVEGSQVVSQPIYFKQNQKISFQRGQDPPKETYDLVRGPFRQLKPVLVFCNFSKTTEIISNFLKQNGIKSFAFHAQMSEIHKLNILEKMDQQVEVARMPKEQAPQEALGKASGGDPAQKPQPVQSSVEKPNLPD